MPSLRRLRDSAHRLVVVATAIPKPAGRGNLLTPTAVADAAREARLPLFEVDTVKQGPGFEALVASRPDLLVVVAYGEILPERVLALPSVAPVNLHFSMLPRLRGASPVQAALLQGLTETGVSTIVMDAGMDTGPVILQRAQRIDPEDDAGTLGSRLAALGAEVVAWTADALADGTARLQPQDDTEASYAPRLSPEDRRLRWTEPAAHLVNLCRAMSPEPGATTLFRGWGLKILRAETAPAHGDTGTIAEVTRDGFVVATAMDGLRPLELAPAGRRRMTSADFVNGYRPAVGERLA